MHITSCSLASRDAHLHQEHTKKNPNNVIGGNAHRTSFVFRKCKGKKDNQASLQLDQIPEESPNYDTII